MTASAIVIVKAMFVCTKAIVMAINAATNEVKPIDCTGLGKGFLEAQRNKVFINIAKELEEEKEMILK